MESTWHCLGGFRANWPVAQQYHIYQLQVSTPTCSLVYLSIIMVPLFHSLYRGRFTYTPYSLYAFVRYNRYTE